MNDDFDVIHNGAVAIHESKIVAVGANDEIMAQHQSDNTIDCSGHYIMPGLINAHTHVPMTVPPLPPTVPIIRKA